MENTLSLLADMTIDADSGAALAASGGVAQLCGMLEEDIEEVEAAGRVIQILSDAAVASPDAAVAIATNKAQVVHVVESIKYVAVADSRGAGS